jgi:hypothetical protein
MIERRFFAARCEILLYTQDDRRRSNAGHSKPLVVNSSIRNWEHQSPRIIKRRR